MCVEVGYEERRKKEEEGCDCDLFAPHVTLVFNVRAAPLVRGKVKCIVKNTACGESSATAFGVFDYEFDFTSHEWSWSEVPALFVLAVAEGSRRTWAGLALGTSTSWTRSSWRRR